MPRMTKDEALEVLRRRPLYNVEFKDAKHWLDLHFRDAFRDQVAKPFLWNVRSDSLPREVHDLRWLYWSIHRVPSLQRKVRACKADDPCLTAMILFLNEWNEAAALLVEAKKEAIKGRKPSTTPRKTQPRTLENTGTCPCCGHNVKLNRGRILDHGFTLQFNQRNGKCFGVGYNPWEISPKGKIDMRTAVAASLETRRAQHAKLLEAGEPKPGTEEAKLLARLTSDIRYDVCTIELLDAEINFWKPAPLPGAKS